MYKLHFDNFLINEHDDDNSCVNINLSPWWPAHWAQKAFLGVGLQILSNRLFHVQLTLTSPGCR